MSRSYFKIGMFIICIALAVFAYKTAFGYTKVKLYETYDNCTVTTSSKYHRTSKGGTSTTYYVKVVREDPDYDAHKAEKKNAEKRRRQDEGQYKLP